MTVTGAVPVPVLRAFDVVGEKSPELFEKRIGDETVDDGDDPVPGAVPNGVVTGPLPEYEPDLLSLDFEALGVKLDPVGPA